MLRTGDHPTRGGQLTRGTSRRARPRAPGLDGLRGAAVLAVLAFHERFSGLPGGFLGVDVFFVISGYLITDLLAAPWDRGGRADLRGFWIRRARRLLPALAVVLITVTAAVALLEPDQLPVLRPALLAAVTYTSNWWQIMHHQSYFAAFGPPPPLQHLWSLAIEEQFYLVWPLALTVLLVACRTRRRAARAAWLAAAASAVAMAAGYAAGADPSRLYYGTDTHASALLIGAALALTWPLRQLAAASGPAARRRDMAGLIGGTVLVWEMAQLSGADGGIYLGGMTVAALAAGSVVVAAAGPGVVSDVLSWAPLRWAGVRSYGIYLWHWPVIALFAARAGGPSSGLGVRVAETALSIGLAAASWRWIEAPILRDGLRGTLRARGAAAARSVAAARQTPRRALPALIPLAALLTTCAAAGYGMLYTPSGPSLQQQLTAGSQSSAASRTQSTSTLRRAGTVGPAAGARGGAGAARTAGPGTVSARAAGASAPGAGAPGAGVAGASAAGAADAGSSAGGARAAGAGAADASVGAAGAQAAGADADAGGGTARDAGRQAGKISAGPAGALARVPGRDLGPDVTAIGDSVMLASATQLRAALPGVYIDAQVGRQMSAGLAAIQRLAAAGALRPIVVVGLGTNGVITTAQIGVLVTLAGPQRSVILVNTYVPRPWQGEVDAVDAAAARRYRNVVLANWLATVRNRDGLLWEDRVHPRPAGAVIYARLVRRTVAEVAHGMGPHAAAARSPAPRPDWRPPGTPARSGAQP